MTGIITNPMSVDLRLWMEGRLSICPYLTVVRFITLLLLYILNCSTFSLNKTLEEYDATAMTSGGLQFRMDVYNDAERQNELIDIDDVRSKIIGRYNRKCKDLLLII